MNLFTVICYFVIGFLSLSLFIFFLDPTFTFEMSATSLEMPVDIVKATCGVFEFCANERKCFKMP